MFTADYVKITLVHVLLRWTYC